MPRLSATWRRVGAGALCAVTAAAIFVAFRDLRQDDAFITFQFARNVGTGHGFVFNPGERVFGATSPLSVLILSLIYATWGEVLPTAAIVIGALSVAAQAWLIVLLVGPGHRWLGGLISVLIVTGFVGSYSFLPLETSLFAALMLGVLWSVEQRREWLCGGLLGLAFLCRYDAGLLVPICAARWWRRDRQLPPRLLLVAGVIVAPWLVWAYFYFGSLLPQTFYAKQHITAAPLYLAMALTRFAEAPWLIFAEPIRRVLSVVTVFIWIAGAIFALRHARQTLSFCIYGIALVLAYSWIGPHPDQHWHLYGAELMFALLFVYGTCGWLTIASLRDRFLVLRSGADAAPVRPRPMILTALVSLFLIGTTSLRTAQFIRSYPTDFWYGARHQRYAAISEWLIANMRPGSTMADPEIGTIGYISRLRMVDPYGLINAPTNDFPMSPTIANLAGFVDRYQPDVVLVNSPDEGAFIEGRSTFRMVKVFDSDPWSTLLVREPAALRDPSTFDVLRAQLPLRASRD